MQVKYDLGDWEKRKASLLPVLQAAAGEGLIGAVETGRLADFLLGRGVRVGPDPVQSADFRTGLDALIATEPASVDEQSEAPRFIRGFHDILITIGVIIGLLGLGGLASVYAVIPACVVLAEILVRRQRLALPAVVLTIAFAGACAMGAWPILDEMHPGNMDEWVGIILLAILAAVSLAFFWRYKVPLALSGGIVAGLAAIVLALAVEMPTLAKDPQFFVHHPIAVAILLGLFAAAVFAIALRFDFADRLRQTRRSDVAFWMHLAAAPALLYTIMALVFVPRGAELFTATTTVAQAGTVVAAVVVLMLIGIVLDRRAFVTSGLVSLGYAFSVLLKQGGWTQMFQSTDTLAFAILLVLGIVVLSLGVGWQPFRRLVVGLLPDAVRKMLPPVRG
jgi:hypothetical protein